MRRATHANSDKHSLRGHTAATAPADSLQRHVPDALKVVLGILESWGLAEWQKLAVLGVPRSTFARWKQDPGSARPSIDQVERMSYVLGIRKALEIIDPAEDARVVENGWLHRPNDEPMFGHEPPLKRLVSGRQADLYQIRRYLDGARGW